MSSPARLKRHGLYICQPRQVETWAMVSTLSTPARLKRGPWSLHMSTHARLKCGPWSLHMSTPARLKRGPWSLQMSNSATEWETRGRQVWETSVGDKCKLMRHKAPRVGDKGETSVNSCGPRHPEWETRGDKCKLPPCLPLWVPCAA